MTWAKTAILAVIVAAAIAAAIHWPGEVAMQVVLPITLVALYAVWRWRR